MSIQRKRPHVIQRAIASLLANAVERGDEDAAAAFAIQAAKLARARQEQQRQYRRDRTDVFRSLGMVRTRNGAWE